MVKITAYVRTSEMLESFCESGTGGERRYNKCSFVQSHSKWLNLKYLSVPQCKQKRNISGWIMSGVYQLRVNTLYNLKWSVFLFLFIQCPIFFLPCDFNTSGNLNFDEKWETRSLNEHHDLLTDAPVALSAAEWNKMIMLVPVIWIMIWI